MPEDKDTKVEETKEETKETEEETETKEETSEEETEEEEDGETTNAINLYKALRGPNGVAIVKKLAEQAGIIATKSGQTKEEAKESVVDVLKQELGTEYQFLAERLGKAIDKALKIQSTEFETRLKQKEQASAELAADKALDKFYSKHKAEMPGIEKKFLSAMKRMPIGEDITYEEYLDNIYLVVTGKKSSSLDEDKIRENLRDPRFQGSSSLSEMRVKRGPEKPTLDEAIEAATKGIVFK